MRKFLKRILGTQKNPIEKLLSQAKPAGERIQEALEHYVKDLGAERGCLLLELPNSSPQLLYSGPSELESRFPFSRSVVDTVLDEGRGLYCFDSHDEFEAADSESLNSQGARSFVCTPLADGELHYGVLYLDNPTSQGMFSQETLADLEKFAELVVASLR